MTQFKFQKTYRTLRHERKNWMIKVKKSRWIVTYNWKRQLVPKGQSCSVLYTPPRRSFEKKKKKSQSGCRHAFDTRTRIRTMRSSSSLCRGKTYSFSSFLTYARWIFERVEINHSGIIVDLFFLCLFTRTLKYGRGCCGDVSLWIG